MISAGKNMLATMVPTGTLFTGWNGVFTGVGGVAPATVGMDPVPFSAYSQHESAFSMVQTDAAQHITAANAARLLGWSSPSDDLIEEAKELAISLQEIQGRGLILEALKGCSLFREYVSDEIVRIGPGFRIDGGGFSRILLVPPDGSLFYKIAKQDRDAGGNKAALYEAIALIRLADMGMKGEIPELLKMGVNPDGSIWLRSKGIRNGQHLVSDLWLSMKAHEHFNVLSRAAMIYAGIHQRGLVQNDIKPGNILTNAADDVMAIDFSLTRCSGERCTGGTRSFKPPDKVRKPYSDIFSFGKVLAILFLMSRSRIMHIPEKHAEKSGLKALVDAMTRRGWNMRHPRDMESVAARLKEISSYFLKVADDMPPLRVVSETKSQGEGYAIYEDESWYPTLSGVPRRGSDYLESAHNDALKVTDALCNHFDYISHGVMARIFRRIFESLTDHEYLGTDIRIHENDIVVRVWSGRSVPREVDIMMVDSSSGPVFIPQGYRNRTFIRIGNRMSRIMESLEHVYESQFGTGKKPALRWLINDSYRDEMLFELRIPLLAADELKDWDAGLG